MILTFWNGKNKKRMSPKMNTFARSKDPDPIGSGLEKLSQFTFFLQLIHSFQVKKTNFSEEYSRKIQVGSKEGTITILKPRSIVLHCTESQSGQSWRIQDPGE
jgi:hypothetical protein